MAADFTWKQGSSGPAFPYTLARADGSTPNLTGATVAINLRALSNPTALTTTGTVTVVSPAQGQVLYTPSVADTAGPGMYMGTFTVTYGGGGVEVFPQLGYFSVAIEPNLTTTSQQLVSLPEAKEYLATFGIPADHTHDAKLLRFIQAATPLIENVVGPVIVRTFDEQHNGGQTFIQLRRRPSSAPGTSPVLNLMACEEYRGPIKYPLQIVSDPTQATIYSCMLDRQTATVYRRTTGGGVIAFGAGMLGGGLPGGVHVIYQAGQQVVPANVQEACLEAIRVNYMTTQPTGQGSWSEADDLDRSGPPLGFLLPRRALELLAPNRRHSSIA